MERVAKLATRRRGIAIAITKNDPDEESIEHEADSESRIGVLSEIDLEIQELSLIHISEPTRPY